MMRRRYCVIAMIGILASAAHADEESSPGRWKSYEDVVIAGYAMAPNTDASISLQTGVSVYTVTNLHAGAAEWLTLVERPLPKDPGSRPVDILASHKDFIGGQVHIDAMAIDERRALVVVSKPYYEAIDQYSANIYSEIYSVSPTGSARLFSGDTHQRPKLKKANGKFYFEDASENCEPKGGCAKVVHWFDVVRQKESAG